mmetsp:Transcript_14231/g.43063  ORF Transcript_14231/g.43063 Transcript_14231/m.43063 type:complete len:257 (+) Transcript_14231:574-1344(+)
MCRVEAGFRAVAPRQRCVAKSRRSDYIISMVSRGNEEVDGLVFLETAEVLLSFRFHFVADGDEDVVVDPVDALDVAVLDLAVGVSREVEDAVGGELGRRGIEEAVVVEAEAASPELALFLGRNGDAGALDGEGGVVLEVGGLWNVEQLDRSPATAEVVVSLFIRHDYDPAVAALLALVALRTVIAFAEPEEVERAVAAHDTRRAFEALGVALEEHFRRTFLEDRVRQSQLQDHSSELGLADVDRLPDDLRRDVTTE